MDPTRPTPSHPNLSDHQQQSQSRQNTPHPPPISSLNPSSTFTHSLQPQGEVSHSLRPEQPYFPSQTPPSAQNPHSHHPAPHSYSFNPGPTQGPSVLGPPLLPPKAIPSLRSQERPQPQTHYPAYLAPSQSPQRFPPVFPSTSPSNPLGGNIARSAHAPQNPYNVEHQNLEERFSRLGQHQEGPRVVPGGRVYSELGSLERAVVEEDLNDEENMVDDADDSRNMRNVTWETRLYTMLKSLKGDRLREINRYWGNNTVGKIDVLAAKAVLAVMAKGEQGMDPNNVVSSNPQISQAQYERYFGSAGGRRVAWIECPNKDRLLEGLNTRDKRHIQKLFSQNPPGSTVTGQRDSELTGTEIVMPSSTGRPDFSMNEYARLLVILRDDEAAKRGLRKAVAETVNRSELYLGVTKDTYWKIIEQRFNDQSVDSKLDLSGRVDEVNANARPLVFRSATELQTQFSRSRGQATSPIHYWKRDWSRSGSNDPSPLGDDPRRDEARGREALNLFLAKVPTNQDGSIRAEGKRALIMFTVCRMGTKYEENSFLDMLSKLQPSTVDGYDEGVPEEDDVVRNEEGPGDRGSGRGSAAQSGSGNSSGSRKRKRNSDRDRMSEGLGSFNAEMGRMNDIQKQKLDFQKMKYGEARSAHTQFAGSSLEDASSSLNEMMRQYAEAKERLKQARKSEDAEQTEFAEGVVNAISDAFRVKLSQTKGVIDKSRES